MQPPKLVHFTEGGPWHAFVDQDHSIEWMSELHSMLVGKNPLASGRFSTSIDVVPSYCNVEVTYEQTK